MIKSDKILQKLILMTMSITVWQVTIVWVLKMDPVGLPHHFLPKLDLPLVKILLGQGFRIKLVYNRPPK